MIKRSFFGLAKPRLQYNLVPGSVQELPVPNKVILLLKEPQDGGRGNGLKVGDSVKTSIRRNAWAEMHRDHNRRQRPGRLG
jgi:hypothetical protein